MGKKKTPNQANNQTKGFKMLEKLMKSLQLKLDQVKQFVKENPVLVAYLLVAVIATIYLGVIAFVLNLAVLVGLVLEEKEGRPSMSGDSLMNGVLPAVAMVAIGVFLSTSFAIMIAPVAGVFMASSKSKIKNPLEISMTNLKKAIVRIQNMKKATASEVKVESKEEVKEENKQA